MSTTTKTVAASATAAAVLATSVAVYTLTDFDDGIDWSQYDLNVPALSLPTLSLPTLEVGETTVDLSSDEELLTETIEVQTTLDDVLTNISKSVDFSLKTKNTFGDVRMMQYDSSFNIENQKVKDWISVYSQYKDMKAISYVGITESFKMITEVRPIETNTQLEILNKNLEYYKSEGYDTVLVTFDANDTAYSVLNTVKYIVQYGGMKVWVAYSGRETLEDSALMDLNEYTEILTSVAPYINGYINSWRRTSGHLWLQDAAFMNYTNATLRSANANLPIVGEIYYGNSSKYDTTFVRGFVTNTFKNVSALLVSNFGYRLVNFDHLFKRSLKRYLKATPAIGVVVGDKPYYLTTDRNNLSYKENMKIKHDIEEKFIKNGCIGVITFSDDNSSEVTNDLTETLYSDLN